MIGFSCQMVFQAAFCDRFPFMFCISCYRCVPDPVRVYVATGRVPAHVHGAEFRTVRESRSNRHI